MKILSNIWQLRFGSHCMTAVGQALQTSAAAGFAAEDKLIAMLKRDGLLQ
jgi:hypothetical protein